MRQQQKADDDAADHVSHDYLQEGEIGVVRQTGDTDDRQRAGFSCNDGESDGPPGNIAARKKVIAQRALLLAEAQAEKGDARQIESDDRKIEFVQAHAESSHQPQMTRGYTKGDQTTLCATVSAGSYVSKGDCHQL